MTRTNTPSPSGSGVLLLVARRSTSCRRASGTFRARQRATTRPARCARWTSGGRSGDTGPSASRDRDRPQRHGPHAPGRVPRNRPGRPCHRQRGAGRVPRDLLGDRVDRLARLPHCTRLPDGRARPGHRPTGGKPPQQDAPAGAVLPRRRRQGRNRPNPARPPRRRRAEPGAWNGGGAPGPLPWRPGSCCDRSPRP